MAALNTLRTKGAIFLSIFIGVALIGFLLQDLTSANSVFQSRRNRVGVIDGNSVGYEEFYNTSENLEQVMQAIRGSSSLSAQESDQVKDMAWESYINRYVYAPGYNKMGLVVGDREAVDMVKGQYISPVISSIFTSPETGNVDGAALQNFVATQEQDGTGRTSAVWTYLKEQMRNERIMTKYVSLARDGVFVNDQEVAKGVAAANKTYFGQYALVPFTTIADSLIKPSSAEVRAYYREHKNLFKRAASRDVEYVTFEVAPSETDYADAAAHIATVAEEFAAAEDAMQYASRNTQERADIAYYREEQLTPELAAIAFGERRGEMNGPTLTGNVYTMSRVSGERVMPDSVGARHILLPTTKAASADSIVRAIRGGKSIMELAPLYSIDTAVDLGVFPPEAVVEPFADAIIAARVGDVFTVDTQYGTHVVEMTHKTTPVRKVQIATVVYNVEPSAATEQIAYNEARDFLAAAAGSKEKFDQAVASTGTNKRVASIGEKDRDVVGLANSRQLVNWSFNAKPGVVSTIFDIDDNYVVAIVTEAQEAGIAGVRQVASSIIARLRTDKKAEMISQQIAGKSIDEIAAMEGASKGELSDMKTNVSYIAGVGFEPSVAGAVEGVETGVLSRPVEGSTGVYVVMVDSVTESEEATPESERVRLEANVEASLPQRIGRSMMEQIEIKDYRAKFF